jgi:hypothetical protein
VEGGGGQIIFLFFRAIIYKRALSIVHEITVRRGGGGLDNLLMSMGRPGCRPSHTVPNDQP